MGLLFHNPEDFNQKLFYIAVAFFQTKAFLSFI